MPPLKTAARHGLLFAATALMVGCDHATKAAAQGALTSGRVIPLITGWLDLRYTENFDTAFSLTRRWGSHAKSAILLGLMLAIIASLGVLAWARRHRSTTAEHVGMALVFAGAVGNAFDRARLGYVIDFIHLHHWPVFNVADILVVVGAGILLLGSSRVAARA